MAGHAHDCARMGGFPDTADPRGLQPRAGLHHGEDPDPEPGNDGDYYNFGGQPAPSLLHWFPRFTVGTYTGQSQATWNVAVGTNHVAYAGEFPKSTARRSRVWSGSPGLP